MLAWGGRMEYGVCVFAVYSIVPYLVMLLEWVWKGQRWLDRFNFQVESREKASDVCYLCHLCEGIFSLWQIQFSICSFQSAARSPTERRQLTCLLSKATASVNLNSDVYWWPSALYLPLCIFEYCVLSYTVYNIHHWWFITSSISNWQLYS